MAVIAVIALLDERPSDTRYSRLSEYDKWQKDIGGQEAGVRKCCACWANSSGSCK